MLLDEFGAPGAVFAASEERLAAALPNRRAQQTVRSVGRLVEALARLSLEGRPILSGLAPLRDYLHLTMAHRLNERARVLHLNCRNVLIRDEQVSEGSIDQSPIYVREVARRALELGSVGIILVHNHPSGDPTPSEQDITLTKEIVSGLAPLGICVHDHIIVAATGHVSMRGCGMI